MRPRLRWYAAGDVNAFFGLALDNLTQLVILSSLLIGLFKFPADLVLFRMIPGTALGVLVGDLTYTWLAVRLARRTGREDVTAIPFGTNGRDGGHGDRGVVAALLWLLGDHAE